ncbi:MAG: hypothetical protein Q7J73_09675 [Dehalococcoidales bacterium]|nr:hypothetical protein [Dehalococcoidales bacterium]
MRLGPLEIILIVIVGLLVLLAVRMIGAGRPAVKDAAKSKNSSLEIPQQQVAESTGRGNQVRLAGVAFIIVAIIMLLTGMSLFRWVMKLYVWSFIFLAIGIAIFFVSRKR